jgi:hypothetical protein
VARSEYAGLTAEDLARELTQTAEDVKRYCGTLATTMTRGGGDGQGGECGHRDALAGLLTVGRSIANTMDRFADKLTGVITNKV